MKKKAYIFICHLTVFIFTISSLFGFSLMEEKKAEATFPSPVSLRANYHYGFTISHNPNSRFFNDKHFSTYELAIVKQTIGNTFWEQSFNYPAYGISLMYSELGNPKYLGRLIGLYPFMDFPMTSRNSRVQFLFAVGLGIGVGTKPFNIRTNHKNVIYSMHFNSLIEIGLKGKIRITPKFNLLGGISFTHMSNGSLRQPNLGINNPTVFLSVDYQINKASPEKIKLEKPSRRKCPYRFEISLNGAIKDSDYLDDDKLRFSGGLAVNMLKRYHYFRSWGVGLDFDLDFVDIYDAKRTDIFSGNDFSYIIPSLKAIHAWHIDKLRFGMELCCALYRKFEYNDLIFANLTLGYEIRDQIIAGIILRAGFFHADYIGININVKTWEIKQK
ncbi:MAG: acyloxyacyl hydrolase [Bacteroidales bacterium]|jgi:hypothetical protein|nr:acyloxyacyl hydrolase [Bacteroidales bacterium]